MRDSLAWLYGSGFPKSHDVGKSTGDERYAGHGTALKPAFEPIVLARKPLAEKTVARNVLEHGTGSINVDACRIGDGSESRARNNEASQETRYTDAGGTNFAAKPGVRGGSPSGRWPANVVLDEHAAAWVDEQSGDRPSAGGAAFGVGGYGGTVGLNRDDRRELGYGDKGGASRFFYVAKASKRERPNVDGVQHPTVKPLAIMRWLIRLVTPPGGTVLDPFAGSGTTIEAALVESFDPVGIEMEADYLPLIQHRIDRQAATLTA